MFQHAPWHEVQTDYNPLFVAALPNRFVALVPESEALTLESDVRDRLRNWVKEESKAMLDRVLEEIREPTSRKHCHEQIERQLRDFPEVHWSVVPWASTQELEVALKSFYPEDNRRPGLFGTDSWETLTAPIEPQQGWRFWEPNDGVLYPAIYDLGDRLLAAGKSVRPFSQLQQTGYRDSLTGEYEWLTLDPEQLAQGSPRQRDDTLWARVSKKRPSWAKKGEHLSSFGLIKRLWPERFAEMIKASRWYQTLAEKPDLSRYVVSTHVMALAPSLERMMREGPKKKPEAQEAYEGLAREVSKLRRPALPRRLMRNELRQNAWWETATKLPALLERVEEETDTAERIERYFAQVEKALGAKVERYYGLLLMDGDRLGAWLSGENTLKFGDTFHTRVRAGLTSYGSDTLRRYLDMQRPMSPARHIAISSALNGFALDLTRYVVEDACLGKLLYAGGDDVMAMVAVRDTLNAMALLRMTYSGGMPAGQEMPIEAGELDLKRGFVMWHDRLYLAMGDRATASCGAVIAHHQTPLGAVLRELRAAEQRAKRDGGRNAFSITLMKRSGGLTRFTARWGEPLALLLAFRDFLAEPKVSRRAVYNSLVWLADLPENANVEMLAGLVAYQFARQTASDAVREKHQVKMLAQRAAAAARECGKGEWRQWLSDLLAVAEFLARETRSLELVRTEARADEARV